MSAPGPAARAARARLPARIFGPDQVDVAYEPWAVTTDTPLRIGPDDSAAPVLRSGVEVVLAEGGHFGRQSFRNPNCLDRPRLRAAVNGWVWGYGIRPNSQKSGWARLEDLEPDLDFRGAACGPAGADFDRRDTSLCRGRCDGRPLEDVRRVSGPAVIVSREVYLRWSPRGTAFRYLVRGDRVRRLCRWRFGRQDYIGVEVVTAPWVPAGVRGWVITPSLR